MKNFLGYSIDKGGYLQGPGLKTLRSKWGNFNVFTTPEQRMLWKKQETEDKAKAEADIKNTVSYLKKKFKLL